MTHMAMKRVSKKPTKRVCITLDEGTYDQVALIAERKGLSFSAIVRSQLVQWLQGPARPSLPFDISWEGVGRPKSIGTYNYSARGRTTPTQLNLGSLEMASRMAAEWLMNVAQITEGDSPNMGAVWTEYHFFDREFLLRPYVWHHAKVAEALLRIYERTGEPAYRKSAILAGEYLLRIQVKEGEHAGALWQPWLTGKERLYVDMNYQCIPALLHLSHTIGHTKYLESAVRVADWFINTAYQGNGVHTGEYFPSRNYLAGFRTHILDEGAFLMLYEVTNKEAYRQVFQEQVDALVAAAEHRGTFSCRTNPHMQFWPILEMRKISSRGQYWHIAPILAAYLKWPEDRYLSVLESSARLMIDWQSQKGFLWNAYEPDGRPAEIERADGGSTAMFVIIWLNLYDVTQDETYLEAAERALNWMLEAQYKTPADKDTFGAFFQEMGYHKGRWLDYLRDISSSFGIIACEGYIERFGSPADGYRSEGRLARYTNRDS